VISAVRNDTRWEFLWIGLVAFLLVVPNLFPFQQYRATGGYLFYSGAYDEPTYLSYDGALATRSLTHVGEHLVVLLHNLGLSGGYINVLFDLTLPVLTIVLLRAIATAIGCSRAEAISYPLVIVAAPVIFGSSNPYYARLYDILFNSSALKWLTLPQAYYPPFFRSPEPQLSLFVAAVAVYVAFRVRSYLPLFVVAPVLYPFVGVPFSFVALGLWLTDRAPWPIVRRRSVAAMIAFAAVAVAVGAFYVVLVRGTGLADFLPKSRLPLVSIMSVVAVSCYLAAGRRAEGRLRDAAFFLAVAPFAAVNTQLIAGVVEAPHNFEQSFGVVAVAIVLVLSLRTLGAGTWTASFAAAAACALLAIYSTEVFRVNSSVWQRLPPPPELIDGLTHNAGSVVIGDPDLADVFSLIAPRVRFSALARSQILRSDGSAQRFARYLCTRELIRQQDVDEVPPAAFALLDRSFRYQGQDFPLVHLRRQTRFRQVFDPDSVPATCEPRQFLVFPSLVVDGTTGGSQFLPALARDGGWKPRPGGAAVVTSTAPWAYTATATMTPAAAGGALADVRARLTVESGCIGIGVLTPQKDAFVRQVAVEASAGPQTADVPFRPAATAQSLVIFNCSQQGASAALIESVDVLAVHAAVRRVTLRDHRISS